MRWRTVRGRLSLGKPTMVVFGVSDEVREWSDVATDLPKWVIISNGLDNLA